MYLTAALVNPFFASLPRKLLCGQIFGKEFPNLKENKDQSCIYPMEV